MTDLESPGRAEVVPAARRHVARLDAPLLAVLAAEAELRRAAVVEQRDAVGPLRVAAVRHVHRLRGAGLIEPNPEPKRVA